MQEIWKNVVGFEGRYIVSNLGNIIKLPYRDSDGYEQPGLEVSKQDARGYLRVNLRKNGKQRKYMVHRLVAEAFIPNPGNLPQVNHKDEDKTNNSVENLEWCDSSYNNAYGTRNVRISGSKSKPTGQYTLDGKLVCVWPSAIEIQRQTGWSQSLICSCRRGERKAAYGYIWKFC